MKTRKFDFRVLLLIILGALAIATGLASLVMSKLIDSKQSELVLQINKISELQQLAQRSPIDPTPTMDPSLLWPAGDEGERDIQKRALDLLQSAEQTVENYERIEPATEDVGKRSILRVEFLGPLSGVMSFLNQTETMLPPLAVLNLQMQVMPSSEQQEGETMLSTQVTLFGYLEGIKE